MWPSRPGLARLSAAAAALALSGCSGAASSQPTLDRSVRLPDGRALHFECRGQGSPTVLFESGYGARSDAWTAVAASVARRTRTCTYDRAGYGGSDPGPEPRDGSAIARDLDEGVTLARLRPPFVLVGHSAGSLYVRLLAARRPTDVVGLVLVDPTVAHIAEGPEDGLEGLRAEAESCAARLESKPGDAAGGKPCDGPSDPKAWRNRTSELRTLFGATSAQVFRAEPVLRDIPRYVLTASKTAEASPPMPGTTAPLRQLEWIHQQTAAEALVGYQRTVRSSHLMMIDRPDAVAAAVEAMALATRSGRPPPPLPPSEPLD